MGKKDNKNKNKKNMLPSVLFFVLMLGLGMVVGILMGKTSRGTGKGFLEIYVLDIVLIVIAFYVQIIIHEAGHLVFGLMSGYSFVSFRIGSLMLAKINGKFAFKRLTLAGTGGQCLMAPPKLKNGEYPYKLYFMGGVLANLILGAISFCLFLIVKSAYLRTVFVMVALIGVVYAVINGFPMNTGVIVNDGHNAFSLDKDANARRSIWLQLMINKNQMEGIRLKDMPEEWFTVPEDADFKQSTVTSIKVFEENRALDALDFEKARSIIAFLEGDDVEVLGLYKALLTADRVFMELIEKGEEADISGLKEASVQRVLKQMNKFPSVIRTEYAVCTLKDKDSKKAEMLLKKFEKVVRSYPAISDVESEKELIALVDRKLKEREEQN